MSANKQGSSTSHSRVKKSAAVTKPKSRDYLAGRTIEMTHVVREVYALLSACAMLPAVAGDSKDKLFAMAFGRIMRAERAIEDVNAFVKAVAK